MNRTRDPTDEKNKKDKAFSMWLQAGGTKSPKGILSKIANALGVTSGTVRGWKSKDNWEQKCNVANSKNVSLINVATERKPGIESNDILKASELYLEGETANKIAKKLGIQPCTVYRWISRYKWKESRERLLIKVTDKLFNKYKRDRFKEREQNYKYAGLIRTLAMQKITGKEYSIGPNGEKELLPRLKGKSLAAEVNALTQAMKLLEETNNFQDKMLGIDSMNNLLTNITNEYNGNIKQQFEEKKVTIATELKILELEYKHGSGENCSENSELEKYDKKLEEWTEEVWK